MKVKWQPVLCLLVAIWALSLAILIVIKCGGNNEPSKLMPGDLVRHKLNDDWTAIVIDNPDGPKIHLRWTVCGHSSYNNETYDVEWERE